MACPKSWNSLPQDLRVPGITQGEFRNKLKTVLFEEMLAGSEAISLILLNNFLLSVFHLGHSFCYCCALGLDLYREHIKPLCGDNNNAMIPTWNIGGGGGLALRRGGGGLASTTQGGIDAPVSQISLNSFALFCSS